MDAAGWEAGCRDAQVTTGSLQRGGGGWRCRAHNRSSYFKWAMQQNGWECSLKPGCSASVLKLINLDHLGPDQPPEPLVLPASHAPSACPPLIAEAVASEDSPPGPLRLCAVRLALEPQWAFFRMCRARIQAQCAGKMLLASSSEQLVPIKPCSPTFSIFIF